MQGNAVAVYVTTVLLLFAKHVVTITVQAWERMRARRFRYPEDAAFWKGVVAEDTESHPYYFTMGAAYLVLGAWPTGAPLYFSAYALSRVAHAYFMLRPRQPHRNRAFAVGVVTLVALSAHLAYTIIGLCVHR